jgi:sulfite exporter TauE/SafE
MSMNQFVLAFITGLTTGGVSCAVVQGGLLASGVSSSSNKIKNTSLFLISKIAVHVILGAVLGFVGGSFIIKPSTQGIIQIIIGLFMLATAARILDLHPIFKYTVIQPPVFLLRYLSKISKDSTIFTPILLGVLTILIPCGVTQAMLILAVGSGSAINGALLLFAFILGTSPVFFALGLSLSKIFENNILTKIAAVVITIIGLVSINNGQVLRGSPHTFQNYASIIFNKRIERTNSPKIVDGKQQVEIIATNDGYKTDTNTLELGVPVLLKITSKNVQSCARSFVIPSMGVNKILPSTGTEIIEFTPTNEGQLNFSCGMGMYTGSFEVRK